MEKKIEDEYDKDFESALKKSLQLFENKKGNVSDEEIKEIADEFGVDIDELEEAITEAFDYDE